MKKIASLLLAIIILISCVTVLSSCAGEIKNFDDLATFISEKGTRSGWDYSITKNISDFAGGLQDAVVTITYESTIGKIVLEQTTEYDDHTVYYKAVCDQNADNVNVIAEYTYQTQKYYYEGYVIEGNFCSANRETAISAFKTNNTSLTEAEAMATFGVAIDKLFLYASTLLDNFDSPVSLYDIGFHSDYK